FGELRDRRDVLDARVRDDRVESAVALECRVDDGAVALAHRQVGVVDIDAVHRPAVGFELLDDRRADPARGAGDEHHPAHSRYRKISSATQTGLSPPSDWTVAVRVTCTPPSTGSMSSIRKVARTREPANTGRGSARG